ncbi:MAG TPA: SDR family oxidoreductase [Leucothrix mucor]|uniref:SDR family oxidoreductase n=1 Tax=Leucothrix mucor TaxID=45248 RepID=A0A7V2WVS0_LEUMU|nr:SDR family oxidoreductase [Leucothrix mucor]
MPSIFITGTNRGIGLALVHQYLAEDWQVYATARQPESATELQQLANQYPKQLSLYALDVTNAIQRQQVADKLNGIPLDILINNAGVYGQSDAYFGNTDEEKWLDALRINTIAPMKIMELLAENIALGEKKIIASMSSKMGSMDDNGSGGSYVYRSTKAALNAIMVSAARDLKEAGISAVILHPGWVRTDMGGANGEINTQQSAHRLRAILDSVSLENSGDFYDIDGSIIPW